MSVIHTFDTAAGTSTHVVTVGGVAVTTYTLAGGYVTLSALAEVTPTIAELQANVEDIRAWMAALHRLALPLSLEDLIVPWEESFDAAAGALDARCRPGPGPFLTRASLVGAGVRFLARGVFTLPSAMFETQWVPFLERIAAMAALVAA